MGKASSDGQQVSFVKGNLSLLEDLVTGCRREANLPEQLTKKLFDKKEFTTEKARMALNCFTNQSEMP